MKNDKYPLPPEGVRNQVPAISIGPENLHSSFSATTRTLSEKRERTSGIEAAISDVQRSSKSVRGDNCSENALPSPEIRIKSGRNSTINPLWMAKRLGEKAPDELIEISVSEWNHFSKSFQPSEFSTDRIFAFHVVDHGHENALIMHEIEGWDYREAVRAYHDWKIREAA